MADLSEAPALKREGLMAALAEEVADMSSRELAFLLLDAMSVEEMLERCSEVSPDGSASAVVH